MSAEAEVERLEQWKSRFAQERDAHEQTGRVADALEAEGHRLRAEVERLKQGHFTRWDGSVAPGGLVCVVCETPVESEPCAEHDWNWRAEKAEAIVERVREMAKVRAISCRALGKADAERDWLDLLAIVDGDPR